MDTTLTTNNLTQTQELAKNLAPTFSPGTILTLYGNLGAGKTTFVQGLAKGLGIEKRIISPTFVIVRAYEIKGKAVKKFYHIDLYRVESKNELENLGIPEILDDKEVIVAIEWAEKLEDLLPKKRVEIYLEDIGEDKREISVKNYA